MDDRRSPLGPLRVPAGKLGDDIIDLMCEIWGTTREEAREAGRRSMQKTFTLENLTPRPMRAPVGAIFFLRPDGTVDHEGLEAAKEKAEEDYLRRCKKMGVEP